MISYPQPGECVHCGRSFRALTWDHVFPKSWYPDTTPPNLEKWQIPACKQCNKEYGKLEEDLLIRIGLCLDPKDYQSLGIPEKVIRALNPRDAKNQRDRRLRELKGRKIFREMLSADKFPREGLFPNFDRPDAGWDEPPVALRINADHIKRFTEKIVKGITYLEDGHIIREPYRVQTFVLQDKDAAQVVLMLHKLGKIYAREPGILVHRGVAHDDRKTAIYSVTIWGRLKLYAHVGDSTRQSSGA